MVLSVHKPDGSITWVSVNSQPVFREGQAAPYGVVATYRDVTKERTALAALADSEERLRLALAAADTVEWDWDLSCDRLTFGAGWSILTGEDVLSPRMNIDGWKTRVHPDDSRERLVLLARLP